MRHTLSRETSVGLLVAAVAFVVYADSLKDGFTLDDASVILTNPVLKGNILSLFSSIDTTGEAQLLPFYRPVTYLTFLLEGRLHGFNPFFIHLCNVLLHSANAFLVFRLARSFSRENLSPPLLAALLFAVHPLHSEAVDFNAGGRNTMLACLFSLTAYLTYKRSVDSGKIGLAWCGALLFLAGLFSKETALMIAPFLAACELPSFRNGAGSARLRSCLRLAPCGAAVACYLYLRWATLSRFGIQSSIIPGVGTSRLEALYVTTDLGTRLLNNVYIIPHYLVTALWPLDLTSRYVLPDDLNLLALPLAGAWLCILGSLCWLLTRGRSSATLFGLAWMFLFWLPVSGIVLVPGAPMADRFAYLPAVGLWIVIADQLGRGYEVLRPSLRRYLTAGCVCILVVLAAVTVRRNLDWENDKTLFTSFVQHHPDNVHAHYGLGIAYYTGGKDQNVALAEREFETVLSMDPTYTMVNTFLGNIRLNRGDLQGALRNYSRALEIYPYDKEARLNRGITLEKLGRGQEALSDYLFFMSSPGNSDNLPGGRQHAEERIRELSR